MKGMRFHENNKAKTLSETDKQLEANYRRAKSLLERMTSPPSGDSSKDEDDN